MDVTLSRDEEEIVERAAEQHGMTPSRFVAESAVRRAYDDLDEAWFESSYWQAREREADEDFSAGRSRYFADADAFLTELDS